MVIYNDNNIIECLDKVESFSVFVFGEKKTINKNEKEFKAIHLNLLELFSLARLMPAFGVSLHNETLKEMKTGKWLQINFLNQVEIQGLQFSALLFKLEKTNGLNLIRLYNGKYEGRCIFLDFPEEIELQDIIKKIC